MKPFEDIRFRGIKIDNFLQKVYNFSFNYRRAWSIPKYKLSFFEKLFWCYLLKEETQLNNFIDYAIFCGQFDKAFNYNRTLNVVDGRIRKPLLQCFYVGKHCDVKLFDEEIYKYSHILEKNQKYSVGDTCYYFDTDGTVNYGIVREIDYKKYEKKKDGYALIYYVEDVLTHSDAGNTFGNGHADFKRGDELYKTKNNLLKSKRYKNILNKNLI